MKSEVCVAPLGGDACWGPLSLYQLASDRLPLLSIAQSPLPACPEREQGCENAQIKIKYTMYSSDGIQNLIKIESNNTCHICIKHKNKPSLHCIYGVLESEILLSLSF